LRKRFKHVRPLYRHGLSRPLWYHYVIPYMEWKAYGHDPPKGWAYAGLVDKLDLRCYTPPEFWLTDWVQGRGQRILVRFSRWAYKFGLLDIPAGVTVQSLTDFWTWNWVSTRRKRREQR
jgi:hypothetical protein